MIHGICNAKRIEHYKNFRKELDAMCIPLILDDGLIQTYDILFEGKQVGIFCVYPNYIDCVYVEPEYRGKGLARQAVMSWVNRQGNVLGTRLHIINNNVVAKAFWNSLFALEVVQSTPVDTLYTIRHVKGDIYDGA